MEEDDIVMSMAIALYGERERRTDKEERAKITLTPRFSIGGLAYSLLTSLVSSTGNIV
jgi:hypothetical protein